MDQERDLSTFIDIVEPRRREASNFIWVSRKLNTALAYKQNDRPKPKTHKKEVLSSQRIQEIIQKISDESGVPKSTLENQARLILDEIGFNKQLKIIRWLGLVLAKICQKVCTGIHVNEASVERLKSQMGKCPVIFAPSHRSYADFILMSYICFTFDIEIPAIAAGMDFHAMWGMGSVLRDTGAFFMRRSINDDHLYWETFKQYVYQIVSRGDLPIEFFIEGTRSRSCKSLAPKYGLLSMLLAPLFNGEVPDVLIVPINISYDRVLEEKLFAFELLGIPKPKESTSGFFKSLNIVKEKYGNIYVDFTTPISVKNYLTKFNSTQLRSHLGPVHRQTLGPEERKIISSLAYDVVHTQRTHDVLTPFNVAAVLMDTTSNSYSVDTLTADVAWFSDVLRQFGARVATDSLEHALQVHAGLVRVPQCGTDLELVNLMSGAPAAVDPAKLKGHQLTADTMDKALPVIMLRLYVHPCLHHLVDGALLTLSMITYAREREVTKDELFGHFRILRSVFTMEFVFNSDREQMEFEDAVDVLEKLNIIELTTNHHIVLGNNERLRVILCNLLNPFVSAYYCICRILQNAPQNSSVEHKYLLVESQRLLEVAIQQNANVHPYCLSLDTLSICLQNLTSVGVIEKYKESNAFVYKTCAEKLHFIADKLGLYSEKCFGFISKTSSSQFTTQFNTKL